MKRFLLSLFASCIIFATASANNVQISNVTTSVSGGTTILNFTIKWDNSWRGGAGVNWDAVWVFVKYKTDMGFWSHLDLTGNDITVPAGLTATVPTDKKGCFVYRSADGVGNIASSNISVGIRQRPGNYDVKVFGLEMVYIPTGPFYLGYSGGNSSNFGEAGTGGATPFQITSAFPPTIGTAAGNLYDGRVTGSASFNSSWPTGYNGYYIMKYELSQAGYRDFMNTLPGYSYNYLLERSDLTNANYTTVGTKLFPLGSRNNLAVAATSGNLVGTNANGNTTYNEVNDGEWTAMNFMYWSDAAAFLDWAALRPMTEFEYEKAADGPDAINYPQFATGTYYVIPNVSGTGILNANTASETVTHSTIDNNVNTNEFWGTNAPNNAGYPLRNGFAADATSTRMSSGGSFYGVMEMTGNVWEPVVTAANAAGRSFNGSLGDGSISGIFSRANETTWPGTQNVTTNPNTAGEILKLNTAGISRKGGGFDATLFDAISTVNFDPSVAADAYPVTRAAAKAFGCRGVRQQ